MMNRIIRTASKLFIFVALAAILAGTVFAQNPAAEKTDKNQRQMLEQICRQLKQNISGDDLTVKKKNSREFYTANVNRKKFDTGSKFVSALMDAAYFDTDENAMKATIIDIVYLIDSLEGQPETVALQRTLKAVTRGTSNAAQLRLEIENTAKSYSNRLAREQRWYFDSGMSVTNLVFNTYVNDAAAMKKNLSEIRDLIKIAPPKVSSEMIVSMNNLAKFAANPTFAQDDYTAIFQNAVGLVKNVNA